MHQRPIVKNQKNILNSLFGQTTKQLLSNFELRKPQKYKQLQWL